MAYKLGTTSEEGGRRQEKLENWLENNNRIVVDCQRRGVVVTNICCRSLRIRSEGNNGDLKKVGKGRTTGLLTEGQNVFIEGRTFQVQSVNQ